MSVLSFKQSNGSYLFPEQVEAGLFSKVKGHSSLAKLSAQEAIPFVGKDIFTFNFDNDISIVGENAAKPAGSVSIAPVTIRPIKIVYQSRVSDEFLYASDEYQINVLNAFADGFAKKLAAGLDKMAIKGINPASGAKVLSNDFDTLLAALTTPAVVSYDEDSVDENIDDAVAFVTGAEYAATGMIMSPAAAAAMGALTTSGAGRAYPEFAFGGHPANLGNMAVEVNTTISAAVTGSSVKDQILVGDFSLFRWGIAKQLPLEVIQYGDPDGAGTDLKNVNQVLLRSEAFIGWGILDANAFAVVKA